MSRRTNFYAQHNGTTSGAHHVDDEVERRAGSEALRRRIVGLQDQLLAALGGERELYLALEDALNERIDRREEAFFNVGFEHGYLEGRREALATATTRGRTLAKKLSQLTLASRLGQPQAIGALLEVAWSLLGKPETSRR